VASLLLLLLPLLSLLLLQRQWVAKSAQQKHLHPLPLHLQVPTGTRREFPARRRPLMVAHAP